MDGRYGQFAERQRVLIEEQEKNASARSQYLIDELAYGLAKESALFTEKNRILRLPECDFVFSQIRRAHRSCFVLRLYAHLSEMHKLTASDFLIPEERAMAGDHIVYVPNFYTERAYEIFAKDLDAPTVSYASDFTDACAEVGESLADLCILPFRDERWASFHSFSRMPEDYGLTVQAVCTVERPDGETMRLSLCGRGCKIPSKAKEIAVEFLFPSNSGEEFEDIRCLVDELGGQAVFAEALPDRYTAMTSWRITYKVEAGALMPLLLGRRLLAPESELLALYRMPLLLERES